MMKIGVVARGFHNEVGKAWDFFADNGEMIQPLKMEDAIRMIELCTSRSDRTQRPLVILYDDSRMSSPVEVVCGDQPDKWQTLLDRKKQEDARQARLKQEAVA
jgi:hypothetical protein